MRTFGNFAAMAISLLALVVSYLSYREARHAIKVTQEQFESDRDLEVSKLNEDVIFACDDVVSRVQSISGDWGQAYIDARQYDTADRADRGHYLNGMVEEFSRLCSSLKYDRLLDGHSSNENLVYLHKIQLQIAKASGIADAQVKELAAFNEAVTAQHPE